MEFAAGPPSKWLVTLKSGAVIELAADSYSEENGQAVFDVLADATPAEQEELEITGRAPAGNRVLVLVARIPLTEVERIVGGWSWKDAG